MNASSLYCYSVYGITLVSELRLNLPDAAGENGADIVVALEVANSQAFRSVPQDLSLEPNGWLLHTVLENGGVYMRWAEWFEFLVSSNGRRVLYRNLSDVALGSFNSSWVKSHYIPLSLISAAAPSGCSAQAVQENRRSRHT